MACLVLRTEMALGEWFSGLPWVRLRLLIDRRAESVAYCKSRGSGG